MLNKISDFDLTNVNTKLDKCRWVKLLLFWVTNYSKTSQPILNL